MDRTFALFFKSEQPLGEMQDKIAAIYDDLQLESRWNAASLCGIPNRRRGTIDAVGRTSWQMKQFAHKAVI